MQESLSDLARLVPVDGDVLELNAGTLSPVPLPIQDAAGRLRKLQAQAPTRFLVEVAGPLLHEARQALADFLHVDRRELLLLENVTVAMNMAVAALPLEPGDEILLTDQEYGAMRLLLEAACRKHRCTLRVIELPQEQATSDAIAQLFTTALTERTRIVFFSHVASPTGLRLPAEQITRAVRSERRFVLIDGAHAPGMIPLDLAAIGADAYGANCHKWMMCPAGAGFLHLSSRMRPLLVPLVLSWGETVAGSPTPDALYVEPTFAADMGGTHFQFRMEYHGIYDRTAQLVLPEAIALLSRVGPQRIEQRWRDLAGYLRAGMGQHTPLACASPDEAACQSCMSIFAIDDSALAASLRHRLREEHRIICPVTAIPGRSFLRVCLGWFNTEEQVDRLVKAVSAITRGRIG